MGKEADCGNKTNIVYFMRRQEFVPAGNTQTILTERRQIEDKTQKNRNAGYTAGHDRPNSIDLILL